MLSWKTDISVQDHPKCPPCFNPVNRQDMKIVKDLEDRFSHDRAHMHLTCTSGNVFRAAPPKPIKTSVPVPLPVSTREMRHPDFSTSDEDDDEVLGSPVIHIHLQPSGAEDIKHFSCSAHMSMKLKLLIIDKSFQNQRQFQGQLKCV